MLYSREIDSIPNVVGKSDKIYLSLFTVPLELDPLWDTAASIYKYVLIQFQAFGNLFIKISL